MTKKEIINLYRSWVKAHNGKKPNRVSVEMAWDDESDVELTDTIAIEEYDIDTPIDDDWILYYVKDINGLIDLVKPNNGSDFHILSVNGFGIK